MGLVPGLQSKQGCVTPVGLGRKIPAGWLSPCCTPSGRRAELHALPALSHLWGCSRKTCCVARPVPWGTVSLCWPSKSNISGGRKSPQQRQPAWAASGMYVRGCGGRNGRAIRSHFQRKIPQILCEGGNILIAASQRGTCL